jgi:hypothetical protein
MVNSFIILVGNIKGKLLLKDQEVDRRMITNFVLKKDNMIAWIGFIWLVLGTTDRFF